MTDNSKYYEAFRCEFEATRSIDQAVAAVVTAVKAQLELPLGAPPVINLHLTVVQRRKQSKRSSRRPARPDGLGAQVLGMAAHEAGISMEKLAKDWARRSPSVVATRWVASEVLRGLGWSWMECGRAVGCHHTTLLAASRKVPQRPALQASVARVLAALRAEAAPAAVEAA